MKLDLFSPRLLCSFFNNWEANHRPQTSCSAQKKANGAYQQQPTTVRKKGNTF